MEKVAEIMSECAQDEVEQECAHSAHDAPRRSYVCRAVTAPCACLCPGRQPSTAGRSARCNTAP